MNYGKELKETVFAQGKPVRNITRYEESVPITTIGEAQTIYAEMIANSLCEPGIKVETNLSTGELKRVVKYWIEYAKS